MQSENQPLPEPTDNHEQSVQQSTQPTHAPILSENFNPTVSSSQLEKSQPNPTSSDEMQIGMSASQLGLNQPNSSLIGNNFKKLILKALVALVCLSVLFGALIFTNIITLSKFKTISYTNSDGAHFSLKFYSKHSSRQTKSGNTQLVSKVSIDGKFPIVLGISNSGANAYNRAKDCSSFTKVFDVQNNNLNQKISVCNFNSASSLGGGGVYIAGIMQNNQAYIITIGQDYSSIDLTSQSGAQQSLPKFGLESYQDDITIILSSVKVE